MLFDVKDMNESQFCQENRALDCMCLNNTPLSVRAERFSFDETSPLTPSLIRSTISSTSTSTSCFPSTSTVVSSFGSGLGSSEYDADFFTDDVTLRGLSLEAFCNWTLAQTSITKTQRKTFIYLLWITARDAVKREPSCLHTKEILSLLDDIWTRHKARPIRNVKSENVFMTKEMDFYKAMLRQEDCLMSSNDLTDLEMILTEAVDEEIKFLEDNPLAEDVKRGVFCLSGAKHVPLLYMCDIKFSLEDFFNYELNVCRKVLLKKYKLAKKGLKRLFLASRGRGGTRNRALNIFKGSICGTPPPVEASGDRTCSQDTRKIAELLREALVLQYWIKSHRVICLLDCVSATHLEIKTRYDDLVERVDMKTASTELKSSIRYAQWCVGLSQNQPHAYQSVLCRIQYECEEIRAGSPYGLSLTSLFQKYFDAPEIPESFERLVNICNTYCNIQGASSVQRNLKDQAKLQSSSRVSQSSSQFAGSSNRHASWLFNLLMKERISHNDLSNVNKELGILDPSDESWSLSKVQSWLTAAHKLIK